MGGRGRGRDRRKKSGVLGGVAEGGGEWGGKEEGSGGGGVGGEYEVEKAQDDADGVQLHYDSERLREVCHAAAERLRAKAEEEREKREKKKKKGGGKDAAALTATADTASPTSFAADSTLPHPPASADPEQADGGQAKGEVEEDDDDALFAEDEAARCEETVLKFVIELRRLYRNACETEEGGAVPSSSSPSSAVRVQAMAPTGWVLSKVHFGRLVRKYKLLNKTCSAQFVEAMWDEVQAAGAGKSPTLAAGLGGGGGGDDGGVTAGVGGGEGDGGVITFDEFLECLVRIASAKWSLEGSGLYDRLVALLSRDLFPALKGPSPMADFRTTLALTCEAVFDKHNRFLSQIFRAYSSHLESSGGVQEPAMTRKDFDEFIEHTQLLQRKVIAVRTVGQLWACAQMDEEGGGGGGDGGGGELFGGSSSMVFWEFLEALAALSNYYERDPYLPTDTRLEAFVEYLQDGCVQVETRRRVYAAKVQGGGGGGGGGLQGGGGGKGGSSGGVGGAKGDGGAESSPVVSRPATASKSK